MLSILSNRLKEERERRGWTKAHVARLLGIKTVSTYANWEYGLREPDADMLNRIANLFEIQVDYLTGRTNVRRESVKYNDAETTIRLIEEEAEKLGLSPSDPRFQKMLSDAFEMLRIARGKDSE